MSDLKSKLESFSKAVKKLNEANILYKKNSKNETYQDSIIKRFEFTFELAWKTTKEYLFDQGCNISIASPKGILKIAYELEVINDEAVWNAMLKDRNDMSHDYNEELAAGIANRISIKYCSELFKLSKFLNK